MANKKGEVYMSTHETWPSPAELHSDIRVLVPVGESLDEATIARIQHECAAPVDIIDIHRHDDDNDIFILRVRNA